MLCCECEYYTKSVDFWWVGNSCSSKASGLEIHASLKDDVLVMIYSRGFWNVVVVRRPLMLIIT